MTRLLRGWVLALGLLFFLLATAWAASPPSFGANPLLSPADSSGITAKQPTFDWADAGGSVISYTLVITAPDASTLRYTSTTSSLPLPADLPGSGGYQWSVSAHNSAGSSGLVSPANAFTLNASWSLFLPVTTKTDSCPTTSTAVFETIPIGSAPADRPGPEHADLNLGLRGFSLTGATAGLITYNGGTDPNAPQLAGLFEPNQFPGISAVYRVNDWVWSPYPDPGHVGSPITDWPVTLIEFPTSFGAPIYPPERGPEIYGGGYKAMVLYAEEKRITLKYTRDDNVIGGYTVHLENVCVDSNLLALYRAQTDAAGWHTTGWLPALRNNQQLGTAFHGGAKVAIRDVGSFMDPRSRKDWWAGY